MGTDRYPLSLHRKSFLAGERTSIAAFSATSVGIVLIRAGMGN